MDRYKNGELNLTEHEVRVLLESLWHAVQRGDIPDDDRACAHRLSDRIKEEFHVPGSEGQLALPNP
jgi:hypothetical protein